MTMSTDYETFDDLPTEDREALIKWFNSKPSEDDEIRLLTLFNVGAFHYWDCPMCGENCFEGDPEQAGQSWDHFQGAQNPDYAFFGDPDIFTEEFTRDCCDACRCRPTQFFKGRGWAERKPAIQLVALEIRAGK